MLRNDPPKHIHMESFKVAVFSLLVFVVACASTHTSRPVDTAQYAHPIRVACVGDSITAGAGSARGRAYPAQLQEMLGPKWDVKNFGVSARTLMRSGDYPYWKEKAFKSAQDFDPDVVVIMLGTNDTKPHNWVHSDEFYSDYRAMVEIFAALPCKPRIYVCRPCPVPAPGNYGINERNVQLEIPLINKLAKEHQLGIIDMHAALEAHPELLPDRVHPNTTGAMIMAETVYKVLTGKKPAASVVKKTLQPN